MFNLFFAVYFIIMILFVHIDVIMLLIFFLEKCDQVACKLEGCLTVHLPLEIM